MGMQFFWIQTKLVNNYSGKIFEQLFFIIQQIYFSFLTPFQAHCISTSLLILLLQTILFKDFRLTEYGCKFSPRPHYFQLFFSIQAQSRYNLTHSKHSTFQLYLLPIFFQTKVELLKKAHKGLQKTSGHQANPKTRRHKLLLAKAEESKTLNNLNLQLVQLIYQFKMEQALIKNCKEILKKNNLHPLKKLGRGGFSIVFLVEKIELKQTENQLYSVKCINKKQFARRPSLYKYIQQEINTWRDLKHKNIVRLVRTFEDQGWVFMLMEYCNKGNIHHVQLSRTNSQFTLQETIKIVSEILDGLEYMHAKNLIHRDIKAENVLLHSNDPKKEKEQLSVKICDLGFVREEDDSVNTFCGTTSYMAPEIFQKQNYDAKVDVWALGVLIYFMLFDDYPFKGLNMVYEIKTKCNKGFSLLNAKIKNNPSISKSQFQSLNQLFSDIFKMDPSCRPSIETIKTHRLFKREKVERNTTASSDSSEEDVGFQIEKCLFLRDIANEVRSVKFLTNLEEISFRFYINKFAMTLIEDKLTDNKTLCKLFDEIASQNNEYAKFLSANHKKVPISKFTDNFKPNVKKFIEFKEIYRMVVGHTFSKAHKSITEDLGFRSRLKMKLFCCHVINRVFQKQHRNQIFSHYYSWLKKERKSMRFDFLTFKKWLQVENPEVLVQTVELMNDRFYKKSL